MNRDLPIKKSHSLKAKAETKWKNNTTAVVSRNPARSMSWRIVVFFVFFFLLNAICTCVGMECIDNLAHFFRSFVCSLCIERNENENATFDFIRAMQFMHRCSLP